MMERSKFLKLGLSAGALLTFSGKILAGFTAKARVDKGYFVPAGKDRFDKSQPIFDGDTFYTKVSGKDTDSDLYVFESTRVKEGGPALHIHYEQDEWWYVLEGEFLIKVGDTIYKAVKGDSVFGPRMVPHCFAKTGDGVGRLMMIFQPAGKMEQFFMKTSEGQTANMTEEERDQFRKDHGFERVGPPLTYLKQ
jgi:mannose-6-phosphate isomerase-like protein (cupin superfamily)